MAPDLAHQDDAPPDLTGRAVLAFAQFLAACAVLVFAFYEAIGWLKAHHAGTDAVLGASAVYGVLIVGLVVLWSRSKSVRMCMTASAAARSYRRRMLVASVLYVLALMLALAVHLHMANPGPLAYAAAILPALPVIGMFVAMGLYLREETDEFQRTVQIESSLWATGGVMVACAAWGFLEMFRLVPHVEAWVAVPLWSLLQAGSNVVIRRRYR